MLNTLWDTGFLKTSQLGGSRLAETPSHLKPSDGFQQLLSLLTREFLPLAGAEAIDRDVHDPGSMQHDDPIAKRLAHPSDLPIPSLGQDNAETVTPDSTHSAGFRPAAENHHALRHVIQKGLIERTIHPHEILSLVSEFSTEDLVHDVAVVRQ